MSFCWLLIFLLLHCVAEQAARGRTGICCYDVHVEMLFPSSTSGTRIVINKPSHEIMVLFVLRKLILQTCMHSHPIGLDVQFLVGPFFHCHTLCVWTAKALARLHGCAGLPEPLLVAYVISTIISWAGSNMGHRLTKGTLRQNIKIWKWCIF